MLLAEPIFLSIQGEGPSTGKPSIFIRFYGCNLCCKWCDSLYAVNNPESLVDTTVKEVVKQITEMNCYNIVFTGGEPSLFERTIAEIQNELGEEYTYEIETNGSNVLTNHYHQINISPKLSNSGNNAYELKALDSNLLWRSLDSGICFKFVAKGEEDFEEIQAYIQHYNIPKKFVYIMPEGVNKESQRNTEVLQFCIDNGYRYCQRVHILLYGNHKGC